jgi:hypothetical protein
MAQELEKFNVQVYTWNGRESVRLGMGLVGEGYNSIHLDPPSKPTVITYKLDGITVATLTIVYSGEDIESVTRS